MFFLDCLWVCEHRINSVGLLTESRMTFCLGHIIVVTSSFMPLNSYIVTASTVELVCAVLLLSYASILFPIYILLTSYFMLYG